MTLPVLYEKRDGIATLTLNRPRALNALTPEMVCRLADAVRDLAADDAVRVAILTGAGERAFCAGGDLGSMIPLLVGERSPADEWDRRVLEEPEVMAASSLRDWPLHKPVIAAVNGACLAAGCELLLGTDIRVAAEHASFGLPEVKRAVIPFAGSMVRLPRQVPYSLAMEMMLTGEAIGATEAHRLGLVNRVVPAEQVMPAALALARRIAENGPVAVQRVKQTVLQASGLPLAAGYRLEDESRRAVFDTEDAREGPRAFMEKRAPRYRGR